MVKTKGLAGRKGSVKRRTETVQVCLDGEAVGLLHTLEGELQQAIRDDAGQNKAKQAPKVAKRIQEVQEQAKKATVDIVVTSLGTQGYNDLMADHPPTGQQASDNPRIDHNPDTFPYALAAACIRTVDGDPDESTAEEVKDFFEPLPGDWSRVYNACLAVNVAANDVPFSAAASRVLRGSEQNSISVEPTE